MKILIISSTVAQNISVGKIATELCKAIKKNGNEAKILFLDNSCINDDDCVRARPIYFWSKYYKLTVRSNYAFRGSIYTIGRIKKYIQTMKPDIIHLIQPAAYLIDNVALFKLLGKTNIPCVYTMIDENAYLGTCDNAYDCTQYISGCHLCKGDNYENNLIDYGGRWSAVGCRRVAKQKMMGMRSIDNICFVAPQWVTERAKKSRILKGKKFYIVDEYVNNDTVFVPMEDDPKLNEQFGVDIKKVIILNVARYTNERKGVKYFLELARKMEGHDNFLFVNVGYDGNVVDLPSNYLPIPFVSDQYLLAYFYSQADLYMTTSLSDTMPNVCLEALSCGTPVCGFDNTGIPYVADFPLGTFVETGNVDELANVVIHTRKKTEKLSLACRQYAVNRFSTDTYYKKISEIYMERLQKNAF